MKALYSVIIVLVLTVPLGANAETVLRVGSDISVESDQTVTGDYYVSAGPFGRTTMSGVVEEDMLLLAGSAVLNGTVGKDLFLVAGTGQVHATVADDVRVIAGDVTISESVGGDLFVLAGTLNILSTATIEGDVFYFGGDANIAGTIKGSLQGTAERVRVDGVVGKDIHMRVPAGLTLGEKAAVAGSVTYTSTVEIVRAQTAVIEGELVKQSVPLRTGKEAVRTVLTPLFVILFAALSLFLLFKRGLQRLVEVVDDSLLLATGFGGAMVIAAPIAAMVLLVTVLGFLLGVMLLGGLIVLYVLALALMGVVLGAQISKYALGVLQVNLLTVVLGTLLLHALFFVPFIGMILLSLIFLVTLGGLTRGVYHVLKLRAE